VCVTDQTILFLNIGKAQRTLLNCGKFLKDKFSPGAMYPIDPLGPNKLVEL
jgi:hypothetical protein